MMNVIVPKQLYESQNIYVVLVGIEVWTSSERIAFDFTNSTWTLKNFLNYRNTSINSITYNDNAHLITCVTVLNCYRVTQGNMQYISLAILSRLSRFSSLARRWHKLTFLC